jgi:hypothetical protein
MIRFVRAWWKRTAVAGGAVLVTLLFVSMFATELTRAAVTTQVRPPITLPPGVDIRYSDRLASVLGRGTPTGRATAITLGYVIIVPTSFHGLPLPRQQEVIGHELVHVQQRARYGRLYLPLYGALYVLRGYADHPLEREARYYSTSGGGGGEREGGDTAGSHSGRGNMRP